MDSSKVVLIGIDGATWKLIKPWIKKKKLPGLKKMVQEGTSSNLESTTPPISPSAWTSIFTGTNPGKHNIFGFVKRKKDSYFVTPISSYDRKVQPIWKLISDSGKRCILLNIPFAYPPDDINGIMTTGLGTPSKNSEFCYPKSFRKELLKKYPKYDVDFNEDLIEFGLDKTPIQHIQTITDEQIRLAKNLFKHENWDFFSIVFRSTDVIQHYYWNDEKVVLNCYQQLDRFIKWILDNLDKNTFLIICSDHGFSQVHTSIYINNWLEKQKLLKIKPEKSKRVKNIIPSAETLQGLLLKLGCKNLVWKLKRSKMLETILNHLITSERGQFIFDIDWSKSKVYFLAGSEVMLNVNRKGREPEGIVDDKDWSKLRDNVIKKILELKDPNSGRIVIDDAHKGNILYKGNNELPDIILNLNNGYRIVGGFNRLGKIFEPEKIRFGDHDNNGIFIIYGPRIQNGKELKNAKVYDIVPTILKILHITTTKEFDGTVLSEIYKN